MSALVEQAKKSIETISVSDAKKYFDEHQSILIDVRENIEVEASQIKGSIAISRGLLEAKITSICDDPQQSILVHCQSGGRACLATEQLNKMGYKNVKAILGSHQEMCDQFN